jgi:hypothetical protein
MTENTPDARWSAVLDELWRHVSAAIGTGSEPAAWAPPDGLGPIPAALVPRAESIVRAQQLAIGDVRRRADVLEAHLKAVRKVPQLYPTDTSVYLDRLG